MIGPFRLTASTLSQNSSVVSTNGIGRSQPALLTRMCTAPHAARTPATTASTSDLRATSARQARARPPSVSIARTVSSAPPGLTSTTATAAPARARPNAMARPIPLAAPVTTATFRASVTRSALPAAQAPPAGSLPRPLVGDLLGRLGDRPRRDDLHAAAKLHDVANGGLDGRPHRRRLRAGAELGAQDQGVLVSLPPDHGLAAGHAARARRDLVALPGVDEHPTHLRHLVGAAAPAEHARRRPPARARLVGDDRQVAGAEAEHRVREIVDGGHELADLPVGQGRPRLRIAHLDDGVVDQVPARLLGTLVGDHADVGGAEPLAGEDAVLLLELPPERLRERLGADLRHLEGQAPRAQLGGAF